MATEASIEEIRAMPVWRLLPEEIDRLPERERRWVLYQLSLMEQDGSLAMLRANSPNTEYESVLEGGQWHMRPRESPAINDRMRAVEDCLFDICKTQTWYEAIKRARLRHPDTPTDPG